MKYLLTPEGVITPYTNYWDQEKSPTDSGDIDYTYLHKQEITIPKDAKLGYIPHHSIGNNHPTLIEQLARTSSLHRRCLTTIANLIAGSGIYYTDATNNTMLPDERQQKISEYLARIGYMKNHTQLALQLYTHGSIPVNIIEGNEGYARNSTISQRGIVKILLRRQTEFRLGLPVYANYEWAPEYHLYGAEDLWLRRAVKGSNKPVSVAIAADKIIDISKYDPVKNFDHTKRFVRYPIWLPTAEARGSNLAHSYSINGNIGFNSWYPSAEYEDLEALETIPTPFHVSAFNHRTVRNGLKAQYIVNVYSMAYAADPESDGYKAQLESHAEQIRSKMVEQGNMLINPTPMASEAGAHAEGDIEIMPIPAPQNTAEYKQDILRNADERILIAHGISPELVGISRDSNSLSNQAELIMARYEMLRTDVVEPMQRVIERFINDVLLTEENGFRNVKANIKPKSSIQVVMMFSDYLTIDEVRAELKRSEATPQQYAELSAHLKKNNA